MMKPLQDRASTRLTDPSKSKEKVRKERIRVSDDTEEDTEREVGL